MRLDVFLPADDTAHRRSLRNNRIDSLEKILNRILKIIGRRGPSNDSDPILIIDPTLIPNPSLLIEHKNFRSPLCAEQIRQNLLIINQHRKTDARFVGVSRDLRQAVLNVGANTNKTNAGRFKLPRELLQPGTIKFGQRTFGAQKRDDEELGIFKFTQGSRLAVAVLDGHGIEFFPSFLDCEAGFRKQECKNQSAKNVMDLHFGQHLTERVTVASQAEQRNSGHILPDLAFFACSSSLANSRKLYSSCSARCLGSPSNGCVEKRLSAADLKTNQRVSPTQSPPQ